MAETTLFQYVQSNQRDEAVENVFVQEYAPNHMLAPKRTKITSACP